MDILIDFVVSFFTNCSRFLDSLSFSIGDVPISVFDILIGFLVISIITSVFWKGGKA